MTEKQKLFCVEYIKTLNGTQAYKTAYCVTADSVAGANANRLLKREDVKEYISQLLKEQKNEQTADIEEIMQFLTSVLRGEVPEEVAHYDHKAFNFRFAHKITPVKDRLKACELLGKRLGLEQTEKTDEELKKLDEILAKIKGVV